jgi:CO/xanthine dehydrogenase Mo-binding subunit
MDTVEFRRRNILREGRPQATGTLMHDAAIEAVLEKTAELMNWSAPFDRGTGVIRRGRAIAIGFKAVVAPTTSGAIVNLSADGSAALYMSTVDMGQGSDTAMAQIVAETLGLQTERIRVVHPDTDVTPYDMATLGSRSTFHMGNAVKLASLHAKSQLAEMAAAMGLPEGTNYEIKDIFLKKYGMQAGNIIGVGSYVPPYTSPQKGTGLSDNVTPFWMVGAAGVEISVDTETGHVTIDRLINVADVGRPLNPAIVGSQLSGAATMQLGFTMFENMDLDNGQVTNASLADYKIPGMHDLPTVMDNVIVDNNQQNGPYGAKGVGETATFGVSPAIANAIEDAVGVRLTSLPLTPEAVLRGIRALRGETLEA